MAQQLLSRALVSASWLSAALKESQAGAALRVLDASFYFPAIRNGRKEYAEQHIPGALYFDIDECKDKSSPYEVMLPSEDDFAKYVGKLGINNDSHVVVYDADQLGMYYAPRAWWMFKVFGHHKVSVLDGGFRNWLKQGLPVTSEVPQVKPETFKAVLNSSRVKNYEDILRNIDSKEFQLVDSRSEGRFQGTEPEPGEGVDPGHIPGSSNLPFTSFLTEEGYEKSPEEIRNLFQLKGIDLDKPLTITCRRGVTACQLVMASYILGKEDTAVFDGSWFEWFDRAQPEHKISQWKNK
ncbi:thiosulfate sulfurtransferase S homeolog [Xenopus laevis]|uniref:LOC495276 protein n=1 Tax=Xenopus laevis TaxID=8355 RepID=Q5XGL5_XENLA|nr:thiosulfate sulfurtransferase S homeolog [Xenopus laevis]AAH84422.1 LOC495276 protein [Xenopus laevis]